MLHLLPDFHFGEHFTRLDSQSLYCCSSDAFTCCIKLKEAKPQEFLKKDQWWRRVMGGGNSYLNPSWLKVSALISALVMRARASWCHQDWIEIKPLSVLSPLIWLVNSWVGSWPVCPCYYRQIWAAIMRLVWWKWCHVNFFLWGGWSLHRVFV